MSLDDQKNLIGIHLNQRYRLEALLGQGGMGEVYRARDTLLKREVAVKVLSHQSLGTSGRTRLLHEAQYIANLNHPNIVTVYDVGDHDDLPFIVMELVEGQTLHETRPDDLEMILSIVGDICTALYLNGNMRTPCVKGLILTLNVSAGRFSRCQEIANLHKGREVQRTSH